MFLGPLEPNVCMCGNAVCMVGPIFPGFDRVTSDRFARECVA